MRLIIISILTLSIFSCASISKKLNSLNQNMSIPEGKALLVVENTSYSRAFFNEFIGGDTVLMQFDQLDGKAVGGFLDEIFHLVAEPGKHTVKILCGIQGKQNYNNHTILTVDAKANHKYIFQAFLENKECVVKAKEAKEEKVIDNSEK
jgi:hypothetical protein